MRPLLRGTKDEPAVILSAVDGSKCSILAARRAVELARTLGAKVHFVAVVFQGLPSSAAAEGARCSALAASPNGSARSTLGQVIREAEAARVPCSSRVIEDPDAAAGIVREAEEVNPYLLVVGSHGRTGIKRMLLGSVAERVVRLAHCPVLVVR